MWGAKAQTTRPGPQATSSRRSPGLGRAAATIIFSASSSVIAGAVLNTVAWRVNWSRIRSWWVTSVIGSPINCRASGSQRSIRQNQHLAVAAALLGTDQCCFDVLDRVAGVDRRLQHAVANLDRQIGINLPHLHGGALGEAAAEVEPGQADTAHVEGGAADRRILTRHRAIADHHTAIGNTVVDPP